MGMSMHVVGFKPPGEKWARMKAVWDACTAAGVDIPGEVQGFFSNSAGDEVDPDPAGVEVELGVGDAAVSEWHDEDCDGLEVDVTKLPKDVTIVRFYNSW